jgi:hypothetical protein
VELKDRDAYAQHRLLGWKVPLPRKISAVIFPHTNTSMLLMMLGLLFTATIMTVIDVSTARVPCTIQSSLSVVIFWQ